MPNSSDINTVASTSIAAASITIFSGILSYFSFYRSRNNKYVTR